MCTGFHCHVATFFSYWYYAMYQYKCNIHYEKLYSYFACNLLCVADDKLREVEMQRQLLEKEAQSYKNKVKETQQKMEMEIMCLSSDLAELRLQEEATRERLQETERQRAALEFRVASLQAEVEGGRRKREEEVASHERQLSDARRQQQMVEEELKVVWREMGKKEERWACDGIWYSVHTCVNVPFVENHSSSMRSSLVINFLPVKFCFYQAN